MLINYDLYDLSEIFSMVKFKPDDCEINKEVITKAISVLERGNERDDGWFCHFRIALRSIPNLDEYYYNFVFVENVYIISTVDLLRDEYVYKVLLECCKSLLKVIEDGNEERNLRRICHLADCLCDLSKSLSNNNTVMHKNEFSPNNNSKRKSQ
ncbi:MAG: hypothetical protein FWH05_05750 [Oscillospiraceae bacterium]|nr:hypothetical protein [Oscillospiraceae bacterium]